MKPVEKTLAVMRTHLRETALLESTMALLEWDEHTGMPDRAGDFRSEQLMLLSGFVHQRKTDPRLGEWLEELSSSDLSANPNSSIGALIRCVRRDFDKNVRLPEALVKQLAKATSLGQQIWVKAKRDNDFSAFQPALEEIISLRREEASLLATDGEPLYDALLDQYEEGAKSRDVASVFDKLRDALIPWVRKAQESAQHTGPSSVEGMFDVDAQRKFSRWVAERIGFDFERGRLDETVHPFCTTLGPHDHRILTRYSNSSFSTGLYGVLHEAGHGLYEQGLEPDWYGTPVATAASLGVHESQSRLWENMVGLSRAFWDWCMPEARKMFPALEEVAMEHWVRDLNRVQCSLIRIEADEV
ncbi:MAG: carboxypeptidase M32, partial [Planctomycetes bacterium]|nr:carboxypeptidase M32 [Planctomycetota bacterium]